MAPLIPVCLIDSGTKAAGHSTGTLLSESIPYNFDLMGRLKTERQIPYAMSGSSYIMSHTYDLLGNTKTGNNSATGITFTNSFDLAARLTDVSSSLAASGSVTYPTDLYNVSKYGPAGVVQAAYAGVPNSTGFFNLFRYYDDRMRLVDNELYPSSDNFGTGTVAIIGGNATDNGWMDIQAGSITFVAHYTVGQSALTVANAFAAAINGNGGTSVIATVPTGTYSAQNSSGQTVCQNGVVPNTTTPCAVVSLKAIVVGQYGDVALSTPAGSGSSFTSTPSNTTLIGGVGSPQGGSSAYVYTLAYAKNGNITQAFDAYNGSWNYGYDTLNRLTSASLVSYEGNGISVTTGPNPGTYKNQCWSYDGFGNRLYELYTNTATPCPASSSNYSNSIQVDTSNHLTGINGNSVSRDASGNLVQDTLNNYIYDAQGRLCAVQNRLSSAATQYVYDAAGNRVAKGTLSGINWPTSGNVCPAPTAANGFSLTATYLYGAGGQIDTELDQPTTSAPAGSWHQNVYGGGGLLATYTGQNGTPPVLYFNMNDWLGTKRVELDTTGRATAYWKSDPFGSYLNQVGSGTDAAENHFTGKERDSESGNDYFGARYYASSMGRFMSPDFQNMDDDDVPEAIANGSTANPQTLNLYSYTQNNPLTRRDYDGHASWQPCADGSGSQCWSGDYAGEKDCSGDSGCLFWNGQSHQWQGSDPYQPPADDPAGAFMMGFGRVLLSRNGTNFGYGAKMMAIAAASDFLSMGAKSAAALIPFGRPPFVPANWTEKPSRKGDGTKFQDPDNPHNSVRIMKGQEGNSNPGQQQDYMVIRKDGQTLNSSGTPSSDPSETHIPVGTEVPPDIFEGPIL